MRLEDLFTPRRRHHDPLDALAAQIGEMRRQSREISRALSHNGHEIADDFGDALSHWGHDAARQGAWLAGMASRKAVAGARAIRHDPLPVIAVLGTAALLASLLVRRR